MSVSEDIGWLRLLHKMLRLPLKLMVRLLHRLLKGLLLRLLIGLLPSWACSMMHAWHQKLQQSLMHAEL